MMVEFADNSKFGQQFWLLCFSIKKANKKDVAQMIDRKDYVY